MGKSGGGSQKNPYEEQAARQAQELYSQAQPILGGTGQDIYAGQKRVTGLLPFTRREDVYKPTERTGLLGRFMDLLEGTYDPTADPMYGREFALGKTNIERGFRGAKDDILSTLPKGGALEMALAENATQKGSALSDFMNKLITSKYGNLQDIMVSFGLGTPFQSTGALTNAASVQANRYAADQSRAAQEKGSFNQALGGIGYGLGAGK